MTSLYESKNIRERLMQAMAFRHLSLDRAGDEIGITSAIIRSIRQGRVPDAESYLRVEAWLASEAKIISDRARLLTEEHYAREG